MKSFANLVKMRCILCLSIDENSKISKQEISKFILDSLEQIPLNDALNIIDSLQHHQQNDLCIKCINILLNQYQDNLQLLLRKLNIISYDDKIKTISQIIDRMDQWSDSIKIKMAVQIWNIASQNFYSVQQSKKCLLFLNKCIPFISSLPQNENITISDFYRSISIIYFDLNQYDKSLEYILKSKENDNSINNQILELRCYLKKGDIVNSRNMFHQIENNEKYTSDILCIISQEAVNSKCTTLILEILEKLFQTKTNKKDNIIILKQIILTLQKCINDNTEKYDKNAIYEKMKKYFKESVQLLPQKSSDLEIYQLEEIKWFAHSLWNFGYVLNILFVCLHLVLF